MDDHAKEKLRQAKIEATEVLRAIPEVRYASLADVDVRLRDYCEEVRDNPTRHNLYEVLSVVRFFHLLDKYDFSIPAVRRFINFAEAVK